MWSSVFFERVSRHAAVWQSGELRPAASCELARSGQFGLVADLIGSFAHVRLRVAGFPSWRVALPEASDIRSLRRSKALSIAARSSASMNSRIRTISLRHRFRREHSHHFHDRSRTVRLAGHGILLSSDDRPLFRHQQCSGWCALRGLLHSPTPRRRARSAQRQPPTRSAQTDLDARYFLRSQPESPVLHPPDRETNPRAAKRYPTRSQRLRIQSRHDRARDKPEDAAPK